MSPNLHSHILISQNFPVSLTFGSDPCETSSMSASLLKQTAMTTLLPFPGPKTFHLSRLLYLVRLSWDFKMEQMHSKKKKKSVAHCSSGKQLSIHLILPLFTVSVEGAAPLYRNSQPDQSTVAVAPLGVRSWDSFCPFVGFRFPPPVIYKAKILGPNATNVPACFNYKHMSTPKLRPWNSSRLKHIISDAGNSWAYAFPYPLEQCH